MKKWNLQRLWMQIEMPNQNLEETSRYVLKTAGHFLFKTLIIFSFINFIVGVVAQNTCLLSDYLRSCPIFCVISPTIESINKDLINVLKRKCPEVFETHLEDSSRFCLGITICIQSLCKFQFFEFLPIFSQNHNFWNLWMKKSIK